MVTETRRIIEANQAYCDMLGYTLDELCALPDIHLLTPKHWLEWEAKEILEKRLMVQGHSGLYEKEYIRRDGTMFPVEMWVYAILSEDGAFEYLWGVARDITERKHAEAVLQRQLRFEEGIAAASACLLTSSEPAQNIPETLVHLRDAVDVARVYIFENFDDPVDGPCMRQTYEVCAPGVAPEIENPLLQHTPYADGFERWREVLSAGNAIWGHVADFPPGERDILAPQGIISILVLPLMIGDRWHGFIGFDETRAQRKWQDSEVSLLRTAADLIGAYESRILSERALREASLSLREVVHAANVGLWDWNLITNEVSFSAEWKRQIGYEEDEIDDDYEEWERRVHPEDLDAALEQIQQVIADHDRAYHAEFRFRHKDGSYRWILAQGSVLRDEAGRATRMLGSHVDITEPKRAAEEHEELREQLAQAQKLEAVGRLAGGVAHDFNNMLLAILGYVGIALQQVDRSLPLHADLLEIQKAARRSADLTRQLLAFARRQTIRPRMLDLNATIQGTLGMLHRLIGENIELAWNPHPDLWRLNIDPSQIDQILANLCVNARDAIEGVGRLIIETDNVHLDEAYCEEHSDCAPGDYVELTVSDTGHGMNAETQSHLFEPFFTTKGPGKGTGLGLSTIYGIVMQNEGHIHVYSEPGRGSTFRIYLPRYVSEAEQFEPDIFAEKGVGGHETILLVEDEGTLVVLGKRMLETLGYRVLAASTPYEAIALAEEYSHAIDLLITDVVMPEMNGRDLASRLTALYPGMKCLFMSGYTADVIAHHGVLKEGVHFMEKPFSVDALARKVREALRQE